MGGRGSMGAPAYSMAPPSAPEPAEVQSIRSMLHIARILAIIFGILFLLGGIAYAALVAYWASICSSVTTNAYCGGAATAALVEGIWILIGGIVAIIVYLQMRSIESKVDAHQYEAAKSQTLLWMILGFIFGIILGIILLVAYLKFDPVINWQRNQGAAAAAPAAPYAAPAPVAPAPSAVPPPAAAPASAAPLCAKCGKPTTYIPQYGRYYCYTDNLYV
jgi:hypothetical protein